MFLNMYINICSAIERVQPRAVSYEEPLATMCEHLAGIFQEQEAWTQAANTLARIDLESGMRIVENDFKLGKYIKISTLYLEDGDASLAESYIKKASSLLSSCKSQALELQYRMIYARILDSTRRFLEACTRYYDLSQIGGTIEGLVLEEGHQAQALEAAVICAILAAAGPQRSRILATLYKDERTASIPLFSILRSVYLERLLTSEEVEAFSKSLKPHHLAKLPDGTTVLERSVIEHNLEACSKLYSSIKVDSLAELLHISLDRAQTIVATMIVEDRLPADIDQVAGLVIFTTSASPIDQWNDSIEEMCKLSDAIGTIAKNRGISIPNVTLK